MTTPVEHIRVWQDEFTKVRRDLHAHPELVGAGYLAALAEHAMPLTGKQV